MWQISSIHVQYSVASVSPADSDPSKLRRSAQSAALQDVPRYAVHAFIQSSSLAVTGRQRTVAGAHHLPCRHGRVVGFAADCRRRKRKDCNALVFERQLSIFSFLFFFFFF